MTDISTAKETVRGFYDSYNQKDLDTSWERYLSHDLVNHVMGGMYDRAAWLEADKGLFPAFGDFELEILDQVAEGDMVATRYVLGGTQSGEFFGVPASGSTAHLTATAFDRVVDGKIVEHWTDLDFPSFLQQLAAPVGN